MKQSCHIIQDISDSETSFDDTKPSFIQQIDQALIKPVNIVSTISGIDKCVRMTSYTYRFMKAFNIIEEPNLLKALDVFSSKLSFTRTIFLRNRKWGIIAQLFKRLKQKTSLRKDIQLILKIFILWLDSTRWLLFLVRLGLFKNQKLQTKLKFYNSDGYFLQCLCWLSFYSYDSMVIKQNPQKKKQLRLTILKYICDSICSYNDTTIKTYVFSNKVTTTLGVLSSAISMYLIWK